MNNGVKANQVAGNQMAKVRHINQYCVHINTQERANNVERENKVDRILTACQNYSPLVLITCI